MSALVLMTGKAEHELRAFVSEQSTLHSKLWATFTCVSNEYEAWSATVGSILAHCTAYYCLLAQSIILCCQNPLIDSRSLVLKGPLRCLHDVDFCSSTPLSQPSLFCYILLNLRQCIFWWCRNYKPDTSWELKQQHTCSLHRSPCSSCCLWHTSTHSLRSSSGRAPWWQHLSAFSMAEQKGQTASWPGFSLQRVCNLTLWRQASSEPSRAAPVTCGHPFLWILASSVCRWQRWSSWLAQHPSAGVGLSSAAVAATFHRMERNAEDATQVWQFRSNRCP